MTQQEADVITKKVCASRFHCSSCHEDQERGYAPCGESFIYPNNDDVVIKACCCDAGKEAEELLKPTSEGK